MVAFGTNEWLVDEIYQQYLKDPQSVDRAWWDFFADYRPGEASTLPAPTAGTAPDADAAAASRPIGAPLIVVDAPIHQRRPRAPAGVGGCPDGGHPGAPPRRRPRAGAHHPGLRD